MINYSVTDYAKIQVDVEAGDTTVALDLNRSFLRWGLDHNIILRSHSSGPTGFICYVENKDKDQVLDWLIDNIEK